MLSVVIPAHNEAENLPPLIAEVSGALDGVISYELIVVDDGSSDETLQRLSELARQMPTLRVVRHRNCCGQSTSLMTGIDAATKAWIATLDGDGQNDPKDLCQMMETARNSATPNVMVIGHRQKRKDSAWRLFCSRVANGVRSFLLKDETPDSGCGIKLFPREAFLKFPRFDHMHRFMPALMRRVGGDVISFPVNHRPRQSGSSHYGTMGRLFAGIIDLAGVSWLMLRTRRPQLEGNPQRDDE
ncbi:MAG: glycosyltransferase family 2 protein [Planctomycetaceae bacterium]